LEKVKWLFSVANIINFDKNMETALKARYSAGKLNVVQYLIEEKGFNINKIDIYTITKSSKK
jgi:hypothetical protein